MKNSTKWRNALVKSLVLAALLFNTSCKKDPPCENPQYTVNLETPTDGLMQTDIEFHTAVYYTIQNYPNFITDYETLWDYGDGTPATTTNTHAYKTAGTYTYKATITRKDWCKPFIESKRITITPILRTDTYPCNCLFMGNNPSQATYTFHNLQESVMYESGLPLYPNQNRTYYSANIPNYFGASKLRIAVSFYNNYDSVQVTKEFVTCTGKRK